MSSHIAFTDVEGDMIVAPRASMVLTSVRASRGLIVSVCMDGFEQCDYQVTKEEFERLAGVLAL